MSRQGNTINYNHIAKESMILYLPFNLVCGFDQVNGNGPDRKHKQEDGMKFKIQKLPPSLSFLIFTAIAVGQFFDEQGYDIVENFDDEWNMVSQKKETGYQVAEVQLSSQLPNSWQEDAKGLPLGLIPLVVCIGEVAGIRERKNALKEFPDAMTNDVFKVLEYNYDQFRDATMQECFLYCALYPEDCEVDRDKLIGRFNKIKRILEDMTRNCPSLSTLILSNCNLTMIPAKISATNGKAQKGKQGSIRETNLDELPNEMLPELFHIQCLNLIGCDLKNLEKLDVSVCRDIEDIIGEEAERSSQSSNAQITSTIIDLPKLIFPGCLI
ncbi:hypothetical protein BC332_24228 [Capsicum chinense]|nr:hypothetical protein BC332_24228 [Capsicum chinense]